jgi:hypothetical protein
LVIKHPIVFDVFGFKLVEHIQIPSIGGTSRFVGTYREIQFNFRDIVFYFYGKIVFNFSVKALEHNPSKRVFIVGAKFNSVDGVIA